jgi:hypothetical protein
MTYAQMSRNGLILTNGHTSVKESSRVTSPPVISYGYGGVPTSSVTDGMRQR